MGELDDFILILALLVGADEQVPFDGALGVLVILVCEHHHLAVDLLP